MMNSKLLRIASVGAISIVFASVCLGFACSSTNRTIYDNNDTGFDSDVDSDTDSDADIDTETNTDTDTETAVTENGQLAWAKRAGGTIGDQSRGISVLPDGSALVTGWFGDTAVFGPEETNETLLNAEPSESSLKWDIFVAKYNPDGTLAWAKSAGGSEGDGGMGIAALSDDSALVTGWFVDTATFGPGETNETILSSDGFSDFFVAKYNADGSLAWAKSAGGDASASGNGISALPDDSALVTGDFQETATFGPGETNETVLSSDGDRDIFVAKYNADGSLAWAKRAGGTTDWDEGNSISALSDGSALVTGSFAGTVTFGPGEINETVIGSDGGSDIFIAKYNTDGTLVWAKRVGGGDWDDGNGISALLDGSALVTGSFADTVTFGQGETGETVLSSDGSYDIFVAKYHVDGTLAWAKRAGGSINDYGNDISTLSDGSALVTGSFVNSAIFGQDETNETVLSADTMTDIFVAKYRASGTLAWAKRAGGTAYDYYFSDHDYGLGISTLSDGSSLVTGFFAGTATFGPDETEETVLNSDGTQSDIFVAKFGP